MVLDLRRWTRSTSTCPSYLEAWWWDGNGFGDAWGLLDQEHGTKLKVGCIEICKILFYSFLWCTMQITIWIWLGWSFNTIMIPPTPAKIVQEGLASQLFQLLQWHAQSLDLNPIEHFLGTSQTTLQRTYDTSKRHPIIVGACMFSVSQFQITYCMTLYEIMPRRINIVLKSRSYWTNYWRFCRQLEQKWVYLYVISHLTLQHTFCLFPTVWPLDDNEGASDFHGHSSLSMCKAALKATTCTCHT